MERRSAKALERIHPDKLDRAKLLSLVEKYGMTTSQPRCDSEAACPIPNKLF